jgi:ribonuclease-3
MLENEPEMMPEGLDRLQERLGYSFNDISLLTQAVTHSSFPKGSATHMMEDYQRLEFLGDAVLELAVRDYLLGRFPRLTEGELSKRRSRVVCQPALRKAASALDLGGFIRLGKGEEMTRGRFKASILADTYEALLGAIYLDGGFESAIKFLENHFFPILADIMHKEQFNDHKSQLQELAQARFKRAPVYRVREESGRQHEKVFEVEVVIGGRLAGKGTGRTKKEAEQEAAEQALKELLVE